MIKTKKLFQLFLCSALFCGVNHSAYALIAPWYLLQAQLKATLDADSCVQVNKLTGEGRQMKIDINVCEYNKAQALAAFVSHKHEYGTRLAVTVNVLVNHVPVTSAPPANGSQAITFLKQALEGNKYFVEAGEYPRGIYAEFTPTVVQYYSDDISDRHGRTTLVAAEAFKQVLETKSLLPGIRVFTSTSLIKKN